MASTQKIKKTLPKVKINLDRDALENVKAQLNETIPELAKSESESIKKTQRGV